jgi:hypothetical protein
MLRTVTASPDSHLMLRHRLNRRVHIIVGTRLT